MEYLFLILLSSMIIGMSFGQTDDECLDQDGYDYGVNTIEHNHTVRIHLRRQKSAFEEHINSPLRKYGITMDLLYEKPKPNNRTNDSIALYRYLDHEFYGVVVVGHPGQTLNVAFDTTWSYTWFMSARCNGLEQIGCYFHNKYDHHKSSEYRPDGRKIVVDGGNYKLTGFFSYDNISIAHSNVTNYSFIEMIDVPRNFILNKADGVMGLGRWLKGNFYEPFFYSLRRQKKINGTVFAAYIDRDHQSKKGGAITLGFIDKKHIKCNFINGRKIREQILYRPVDTSLSYWQFKLNQIVMVMSKSKNRTIGNKDVDAIIDTSSSVIYGPPDDIALIHSEIGARKFMFDRYLVDCDKVNKLPKIVFMIGNKVFEFTGPKYITKLTFESISVCLSAFKPAQNNNERVRWILGTTFVTEVYTIFDVDQNRIGFVHAA